MKNNTTFYNNLKLTKLDKGKTNEIFLSENGWMVKKYSNITINNEPKVLKWVEEFDVELIAIDNEIKITKYIKDGLNLWETPLNKAKSRKVGKLLRKFHDKNIDTDAKFNPIKILQSFFNKIQKPLLDYDKYKHLVSEYEKLISECKKMTLCHNDLQFGNWLFSKDKLYLIDWEYAGMNDPLYDVASFISENSIEDKEILEEYLSSYFGKDKIPFKKISIYYKFQSLFWAAWANMMYDIKKDKSYLDINVVMINNIKEELVK